MAIQLNPKELQNRIVQEVSRSAKFFLRSKINRITSKVEELIRAKLTSSEEYNSIVSGEVNELLEIDNASSVLSQVVNTIVNNLRVEVVDISASGDKISGSIRVTLFNGDYSQILSALPDEILFGQTVNWLRWLVLESDSVSVFDFGIDYKEEIDTIDEAIEDIYRQYGVTKTQNTFLKQKPSGSKSIRRIPVQFIGSEESNFLVNALGRGIEKDIELIFQTEFK